jgi:hypothetical protein
VTFRTITFDSSTDSGAALRHNERLQECCNLLGTYGIALEDLHKWSDVLSLELAPTHTEGRES